VERGAGDAGGRGAGDRRGAGRHRDRPVRGDPGGRRLQPLLARRRPAVGTLRELHGGVLEHPAAQRAFTAGKSPGMRPRKLVNQINIVPYVDVMLVLLVIFMVTAPLVNPGVIDLPSVGKSSQPPP